MPRAMASQELRLITLKWWKKHDKTEGEVIMQAQMLAETKKNYQNLADSHWVVAQHSDMAIRLVIDWLRRRNDDH